MKSNFFALAALSLALAIPFAFADVNQAELDNCLCQCGCLGTGWACGYNVGCSYNTDTSSDPPDTSCGNIANGPCRCSGGGCGRAQMPASGDCYSNCMVSYGGATPTPVAPRCGDYVCQPSSGENCGNCVTDCVCLPNTEACSPGDASADGRGCIGHFSAQCGDGSCNGYETAQSCPDDCARCGDGMCSSPFENYDVCPTDCPYDGSGMPTATPDYSGVPSYSPAPGPTEEPPEPDVPCSTAFILGFALLGTLYAAKR